MPELWRTVAENERYEVSSLGNVRHKKRMRNLKPGDRRGYAYVQLGSRLVKRSVHVLVCTAWHGPRPEGMLALHRNDNKRDNRPENLYWGTRSENTADAINNDRLCKGESVGTSKLTEQQVKEIRAWLEHGLSCKEIAKFYEVQPGTIRFICKGSTWKHLA